MAEDEMPFWLMAAVAFAGAVIVLDAIGMLHKIIEFLMF